MDIGINIRTSDATSGQREQKGHEVRRRKAQGPQEEDIDKEREVVLGPASKGQVRRAARNLEIWRLANLFPCL